MKISDLDFCLAQIPRRDGGSAVRSLLVCLTTDAGCQGWGESPLPWRAEELLDRRRVLLPVLSGRSVFDTEELVRLEAVRKARLATALEMAAWDLVGRSLGQPLCHLLGGSYRQRAALAVRLPGRSATEMAQVARERARQGFYLQTITARGVLEEDVQGVLAVAEAVGERVQIQLDGGGRYELQAAQQLALRLAGTAVSLLLDLLPAKGLEAAARLARRCPIPLGLSHPIAGPRDVMQVVRSGAAAHLVLDLQRVGGLSAARKCAAVAEAGGLSVSLAAENSLGIALAASLQLAAAIPALGTAHHSDYSQLHEDLLVEPLLISDGMAAVPQTPGLGVTVDRAKLEGLLVN